MTAIVEKKARIPMSKILTIGLLPSKLKVFLYKLKGAKIGKNVHIGFGSIIEAEKIELGDNTSIGFFSIIKASELKTGRNVKIGAMCFFDTGSIEIDDDCDIHEQVFAGGIFTPNSILKLGKRVTVFQFTFLNPTLTLTLEDDVGIGGRCSIFTHSSRQSILEGYPVKFASVTIKKNVWLPWNVFVLPGVTIGEGATIGANSLVNKDIPPGSLAVGIPAKVIKEGDEYPQKLSRETKIKIFSGILDEFADYLKYFGFETGKLVSGSRVKYDCTFYRKAFLGKKQAKQSLLFSDDDSFHSKEEFNDVVVALGLSPENIAFFNGRNVMWFDLEAKKWGGTVNELGEELKKFLTRYGIRFI